MFEIIGILATTYLVIYILIHVVIKVYNWAKHDVNINFEIRKTSLIDKDEYFYFIPSIGFSKASRSYLEISITWLGMQYYSSYCIKNFDEDYD
jgi:hypothetical protein